MQLKKIIKQIFHSLFIEIYFNEEQSNKLFVFQLMRVYVFNVFILRNKFN